jgi:putative transposase
MPHYRRHYIPGHPVFVTIVTHQRHPWLRDADNLALLRRAMARVKHHRPFRHIGHVVLPDHLHWLFDPAKGIDFSEVVAAVKREVSWRWKERERSKSAVRLWQPRFYDHVIRDEQDLARHLDYIHFNPVKHGLMTCPRDYPWSSFTEWCKRGRYSPEWGVMEPKNIADMDLE